MQITGTIKERLGTWVEVLAPFIQTEKWDKIFSTLKNLSSNKIIVIPKAPDVFKSFELCDRKNVKAVVILMDPYPSLTKKGEIIADGVPMSCKGKERLQPTLDKWYMAIEEDFGDCKDSVPGFMPDIDRSGDIDFLLKEEGVLLLNSSLTCIKDKPGSHADLWFPYMQFLIEDVLNKYYSGLPVILCGAQAQKLEKFFNPLLHYVLKVEHPVAAGYAMRPWNHQGCFKWVNSIIKNNNGEEYQIKWYRTVQEMKGEVCQENKEKENKVTWSQKDTRTAKEHGLPWED